ncbi:MAG: oligosaccharide flippase family protein [Xanthobacteraceae bacterium]
MTSAVPNVTSLRSLARMASILTSGSGAAQFLNFVGTIIIARLFSPTDFGLYSIFLSVHMLCAVLVTMRYELALVVDPEKDNIVLLAALTTWLIIIGSMLLTGIAVVVVLFGGNPGLSSTMKPLIWLLPPALFCAGQYMLATQWCIRIEAFSAVAVAGVSVSIVTLVIQALFGIWAVGAVGLVWGFIGGQAAGMLVVWIRISRRQILLSVFRSGFDWPNLRRVARRHFRFPAFQMPNSFSSAAYSYFPAVILGSVISPHAAGAFSMAFKLSFQPLSLLPAAFGQVIFSRLSRSLDNLENWERPLSSCYLIVGVLMAGPVGILMIIGPQIISTLLGEEWLGAGYILQILVLPCFLMALAAGYDRIYDVVGRQFLALILSVVSAITVLVAIQFTAMITVNVLAATLAFALVHTVYSLTWTVFAFRSCGFSTRAVVGRWLLVVGLVFGVALFTKLAAVHLANAIVCGVVVECLYLSFVGGAWLVRRN